MSAKGYKKCDICKHIKKWCKISHNIFSNTTRYLCRHCISENFETCVKCNRIFHKYQMETYATTLISNGYTKKKSFIKHLYICKLCSGYVKEKNMDIYDRLDK